MELDELLALMAAPIYTKMRPVEWQFPGTSNMEENQKLNEAMMKSALDEAKKLWRIVNANPSVWE